MLLTTTQFIGPLNSVIMGKDRIEWIYQTCRCHYRYRLTWSRHLNDVKKTFLNKLNLLKRTSFLGKNALLDLYFKVILPYVLYGLIVWGGCTNAEQLNSLETHGGCMHIFGKVWRKGVDDRKQLLNVSEPLKHRNDCCRIYCDSFKT